MDGDGLAARECLAANQERFQAVAVLFLKVCDLAPKKRRKVLRRTHEEQPELLAEVKLLLVQDRKRTLRRLSRPLPEVERGSDAAKHLTARLPSNQPNEVAAFDRHIQAIAGYDVLKLIAAGGMGSVWRAVQHATKRTVALKVLDESWTLSEQAQARFRREVQLTAKLRHPHIVRVCDPGMRDGGFYYAMELIDGLPLDQFVEQRRLNHRQIALLMQTVCEAVGYVHQQGIAHCDLKPANILVTPDGAPHVVDFGLADVVENNVEVSTVTPECRIVGTVPYMAPEQAAGGIRSVNQQSDVYELGMIMYRLLTGGLPYDTSGPRCFLLRQVVEAKPLLPSSAESRLEEWLEAILLKALAQDPANRFTSANEFADSLKSNLCGTPSLPTSEFALIASRCTATASRISSACSPDVVNVL